MADSKLTTEHRRHVIEDVIWLTDCGEHPENIARRLGYKEPKNLERTLHKWGEPSLARRMSRRPDKQPA